MPNCLQNRRLPGLFSGYPRGETGDLEDRAGPYTLAYALREIKPKGPVGTFSEDHRSAIATLVLDKLRERGDPWHLDDELPPFFHGPPTQRGTDGFRSTRYSFHS
jgi:hypothetical protein